MNRKSELHIGQSRLYDTAGKEFADYNTVQREAWRQFQGIASNALKFAPFVGSVFSMAKELPEFNSPRELIGHASDHIDRLEGEIKAFFDSEPFAHVVDVDRDARQEVYKFRLTKPLPNKIRLVFKDATSNLRDALDHAVYAAALAINGGSPQKTGFPFANDATHLEGELNTWKFADIPGELHTILMGFNPYPGGNDLLIGLNRMRNPNTHRVIVPVVFATMGTAITNPKGTIKSGSKVGYSKWDPAKNEVEYMRLSFGSDLEHNVRVTFSVTFGEVETLSGKPVVPALRRIASEVNRVVLSLEAETARLLALRP